MTLTIFDFQVRDFSAYAIAVHGKASSTDAQQEWAIGAVRKPAVDQERFDRVWAQVYPDVKNLPYGYSGHWRLGLGYGACKKGVFSCVSLLSSAG